MSMSKISDKNIIVATFDDVPEEVCKAFEECKKARGEEMSELLACYTKDHHGSIMQIKEPILPLIDSTKEVHTANVLHSSTFVSPQDVSAMFPEHVKFTRNMVGEEIDKGLAKFSQNSKYHPTTLATTHPTAPSPSATPSTSVTQPPYGMPLNYFGRQTPPAHNTSMTLYRPEPTPISTILPTSAIPGLASFMLPLAPAGADSNTTAGIRYATPHAPQPPPTDRLNETTARIWEGVEARLRDMGLSPISHRIYQKSYPSIFDSVAYPAGWRVPNFSKLDGEGSCTTWKHMSQYLAQLGEAGSIEALRVQLFSLLLT
jgi:hypothetical protein